MNKRDFIKLIGAEAGDAEYLPVACLLHSGYACAGFYNERLNTELTETCILVNSRLVGFQSLEPRSSTHPRLEDFAEFIEEVVLRSYKAEQEDASIDLDSDVYGKSVPLAAIPLNEIAIIYPVAHINKMMRALQQEKKRVPAFLDFDHKSIVLKILRTKLW